MCEKCDRLAALIEQTRSGKSWVEWAFPNGEPRLVQHDPSTESSDDPPA
jgi:hypothetical protein